MLLFLQSVCTRNSTRNHLIEYKQNNTDVLLVEVSRERTNVVTNHRDDTTVWSFETQHSGPLKHNILASEKQNSDT